MEVKTGDNGAKDPAKVYLKSSNCRLFEATKPVARQLKQLTTMLSMYEECEVTAPLRLDRIDGETLAAVLEWCELFQEHRADDVT